MKRDHGNRRSIHEVSPHGQPSQTLAQALTKETAPMTLGASAEPSRGAR